MNGSDVGFCLGLTRQLRHWGAPEETLQALAHGPEQYSHIMRALRLLVWGRETPPPGNTAPGRIWQQMLVRRKMNGEHSFLPLEGRTVQMHGGPMLVLVPNLPDRELITFALDWLNNTAALCGVKVLMNLGEEITLRNHNRPWALEATPALRWVQVNADGEDPSWYGPDGWDKHQGAGIEYLLGLAQHPSRLMDPFKEGGRLGIQTQLRGLGVRAGVRSAFEDEACVEVTPGIRQGGVRVMEITTVVSTDAKLHTAVSATGPFPPRFATIT